MEEVLDVNKCDVDIQKKRILSKVSFHVYRGEIMALVGHNGAGKSTLMKTIIGSREKVSGNIAIRGYDQDEQYRTYKLNFTYIPEEPLLFNELTVYHHFRLFQQSYAIPEEVFKERVDHYVQGFELTDKLDEYPEALSKGMRQKVQTICALLPDVPILFIDEPFMGLDVYAGAFLEKELQHKRERGGSIVLTTHQLDKVSELADRYVMLVDGLVSSSGNVSGFNDLERRWT
ncbi:ABC-2 type transport system ATP-binding protein [Halobacillus karajensis]|uniref:ABC-type transporter ATP-binding protein EcsA n=1 Tax=Halobacillus karajensis TaxID=195088 RepID=A0A059NX86_9BACI|nr:ABC transporter ATP-binding protein [Halobacillus karajensis]CDQ18595.1 ABC-type transporter ATP-binding protein EcsA [Halobacillus karajensis]CDQ23333.1 ABC-type transporter ATP-binding protein EcsA [Halobacillus karajensis]CDQ26815.1 ABC-type transporter ATP-binding protein EcsA [Halobacillus karajensis]SEH49407.1 ABC-2 type transport system ATP-binding protein [Halobacillus karajensis]